MTRPSELMPPGEKGARDAEETLRPYLSSFGNWDRRASVRVKPERRISVVDQDPRSFFSPQLAPEMVHPLVVALGNDAVRQVAVQRLYGYLDFTAELEAALVIPVATDLARNRAGIDIPVQMQADGYNIVTDEAYHAQFSDALNRQLVAHTGVAPVSHTPSFFQLLIEIERGLTSTMRTAAPLTFAICSETLISGLLVDLPRNDRLLPAVRQAVRDHAEDEGRHNVYFRSVLERFWPSLNADQRRAVGQLLPRAILAFLQPDYTLIHRTLVAAGLPKEDATQVVIDSYPSHEVLANSRDAAAITISYLDAVGAFKDSFIRESFDAFGLMDTDARR